MENKWPKWKFQNGKFPVVWDPILLPRPFEESRIRYMEFVESTFVLILSEQTNIEIWNVKSGSVCYQFSLKKDLDTIDWCGLYRHKSINKNDSIEDWSIFLASQNGLIFIQNCSLTYPVGKLHDTNIKNVNKCFYKLIYDIKCFVLINELVNILDCFSLSILIAISNPVVNIIDCLLVTDAKSLVFSSDKILCFHHLSIHKGQLYEDQLMRKHQFHKNRILSLIEVDEDCLASISSEAVKIWKRPDFNITRVFTICDESNINNEKSIHCIMYNSRYLALTCNSGIAVFDCISGSILAKISDAHNSKIIGLAYCNCLSMLMTIAEDGVSRFWGFQLTNINSDFSRYRTASQISKSYISYFINSHSRSVDERVFLGKSLEKCDKDTQQMSCFLELKYLIKSQNHFINLEEVGMLTNDGSSNLILWRNRDYAIFGLMKLL